MILVVDDDALIRQFLTALLRGQGHEVATACDGREALAWLAENPRPQLILLDIQTPHLTGLQVLQWLQTMGEVASVPVIILSGMRVLGYQQVYPSIRAVHYKPFRVPELLRDVQGCIQPR